MHDRAGEIFVAVAIMGLLIAAAVMTSAGNAITVGENAATREQVYQACLDEYDTSTASTYAEYESMVPGFIAHAKECERRYLNG